MDLPAQAALGVHILFGTAAVIAGALPIFAPKRKGFHTRWGGRFVFCMGFVLSSAVVLTLLFMNPYFAALTVTASILTISGVRVLRRKRPDLRRADRARAVDWAVAIAALAVGGLVLRMQMGGGAGGNPVVIYALVGSAFVYGTWDLLRFAFPAAWPFFPGLWFYEHLVKMLGAYSAVLTAFSGSVAMRFLPDPWKQLWATILFNVLTLAMIVWYARRRRMARAAAGLDAARPA